MKKESLKKIVATFIASVTVAAFALALLPSMASAKATPFMKIVPGYATPGYKLPTKVYRPKVSVGYKIVAPAVKQPGRR